MPSTKRPGSTLYCEIPPDLHARLRRLAHDNRRTVTAEVILALEAHLGGGKRTRKENSEKE